FDAIYLWHQDIENDEVRPVSGIHLGQCFLARADGFHVVAVHFQECLQIFADTRLVIHHHDSFLHSHLTPHFLFQSTRRQAGSIGSRKVNLLPEGTAFSTQIFPRWACTNRFAIASPSPIPDVLRSNRTKSSKIS